ncbi:MAG: helix-turn-helix domain-containing protein [Betaproteobacteria bacterium]
MKDGPSIVGIAALIGDHARAEVLTALLADRALTATELAHIAGVTKQTISTHLSKLRNAGLIAMEAQGRHRYFRLAGADVAQLLESLLGVAFRTGAVRLRSSPREPALRKSRLCYDHLAGEMGVFIHESLVQQRALVTRAGSLNLTAGGRQFFLRLGIDAAALPSGRRVLCRACLDWSERRHHLAGALGAALCSRIFELGWATRDRASRVVAFTTSGEKALRTALGAQAGPIRPRPLQRRGQPGNERRQA